MKKMSIITEEDKLFQTYLGISKEQFEEETRKPSDFVSKKPFECPHGPCKKTVALAQYLTHFKLEHSQIQCHNLQRNEELVLPFAVDSIRNCCSSFIAKITVYEVNKLLTSSSSASIVKTCEKFSLKTPLDSFWIMVAGVPQNKTQPYCVFWIFTTSEEEYKCTLELSTRDDARAFTVKCKVANALEKDNLGFVDVRKRVQGLVLSKNSIVSLLKAGLGLNLRVIVH